MSDLYVCFDNQLAQGWKWFWRVGSKWHRGHKYHDTPELACEAGRTHQRRYRNRRRPRR